MRWLQAELARWDTSDALRRNLDYWALYNIYQAYANCCQGKKQTAAFWKKSLQFYLFSISLKLFLFISFSNPDSGLVVPSVSYELHKKLLSVAEKHGLTLERRLEMTGVCASQMALSLLGGPNR